MCGINGIASTVPVAERGWVAAARDAMRHRGPDGAGEWWSADGRVGLGHRRLAIVDLSPGGHQPMADAAGELHVVFNGEIYNFIELRDELAARGHVFRSRSDTEVLLAAYREWDTDCLRRLNGMFAFALHDARKQRLFAARDRAGEKPFYYRHAGGTLQFASELKALMADPSLPRRIDADAFDCLLALGYVPGERCILQGVRKLPPAHALLHDLRSGELNTWRYWELPAFDPAATPGEDALLDELESLLADAVRRQLVADVPVGVLLSGGVDSSLVTAMAVRATPDVRTFTVRFPGHGSYDETEHARLVASHFGTRHEELEAGTTGVDVLPLLARQFDEPMVDSSMLPTYLVSRLIREHCTVALGGDGGDELFGGYPLYSRLLRMRDRLDPLPRSLRQGLAGAAGALLPVGLKGRNWLQTVGTDFAADVPFAMTLFDRATRRRLPRAGRTTLAAEAIRAAALPPAGDLLQRATRMDFLTYLPEDLLVKVDRASMLSSLEVRAPLLDHRLVEFAFGKVPGSLKATPARCKILLKKLTGRVLPPAFDRDRKQGFSVPLSSWLQAGPWQAYFRDVLSAPDGSFSPAVVDGLFAGQARGMNNGERLFGLVMFELWRREYRANF